MATYKPAPLPSYEIPRLKELYNLEILNTEREERFLRYVKLTADIFKMPIVTISLIDADRLWFKANCGFPEENNARDNSFCSYTILEKELLVVDDTLAHPIFANNPSVRGKPDVRFYAGVVLRGPNGLPLGTLCVMGTKPQKFSKKKQQRLLLIAKMVEHELHYNYHLNEMRKKVEQNVYYDMVTGLPNKRLLQEQLSNAIKHAKNAPQRFVIASLVIVDYAKLKEAFGQSVISELILQIRDRLVKALAHQDIVLSYERDHFLIAFLDQEESSLVSLVHSINNIFSKLFKIQGYDHKVDGVVGVSIYPQDSDDVATVIEQAIATMQRAANNKLPFEVYSQEKAKELSRDFNLAARLHKALQKNEVKVFYQPKIDILTGRVSGAEALSRWQDENGNYISPLIFTAIAEQSNQMIALTNYVLRRVCKDIKKWLAKGVEPPPIAINIPREYLLASDFPDVVKKITKEEQVEMTYFVFEVLETSLFSDMELAIKKMTAAQQLGIAFALDDFGTGYSSLNYIKQLPVNILKIDKAFIKDITHSRDDAALVHAIIAFAKALNKEVVAEGVETPDQLLYLKAYNCDQAQGFLFSKAIMATEFFEMLLEKKSFL